MFSTIFFINFFHRFHIDQNQGVFFSFLVEKRLYLFFQLIWIAILQPQLSHRKRFWMIMLKKKWSRNRNPQPLSFERSLQLMDLDPQRQQQLDKEERRLTKLPCHRHVAHAGSASSFFVSRSDSPTVRRLLITMSSCPDPDGLQV